MSSKVVIRCSEVCIRSGLAALILAGVAFGLLPVTDEAIRINSLRQYLNLRLALAETVNQIENDGCWKSLASQGSLAFLSLEEILQFDCVEASEQGEVSFTVKPKQDKDIRTVDSNNSNVSPPIPPPQQSTEYGFQDTTPPRPPSMPRLIFFMNYEMPQLAVLKEILTNLGTSALLESARQVGPRFEHAIFRWEQYRRNTAIRRLKARGYDVFIGSEVAEHNEKKSEEFSWTTLSISDVTNIARYELPTYDISDEIENRKQLVNIPSVPIPMDLRVGATILLGGLLLVATFFWLYYQEARRIDAYPGSGTIFAVLHHQKGGRLLFSGVVLIPLASAVLLASKFYSRHMLTNSLLQVFLVILLSVVSLHVIWNSGLTKRDVTHPRKTTPENTEPTTGGA